jgi:hypothetical protein
VSQFAEKVGGSIALDVLSLDAFEKTMAHRAEAGVGLEMIDEDVGFHENVGPAGT